MVVAVVVAAAAAVVAAYMPNAATFNSDGVLPTIIWFVNGQCANCMTTVANAI